MLQITFVFKIYQHKHLFFPFRKPNTVSLVSSSIFLTFFVYYFETLNISFYIQRTSHQLHPKSFLNLLKIAIHYNKDSFTQNKLRSLFNYFNGLQLNFIVEA
ncbi:hypothetical protein BpHYR1_014679 [Brachionus plicatilis]|uniref:Uncharacterized protein n=1 Tax=Brachionus plicatilis TaxID=10195 RepID=A0A3M7RIA5_BRAPC|nr:hypothetical protein BpHYR1_014679 [Brachionus plicatilis]